MTCQVVYLIKYCDRADNIMFALDRRIVAFIFVDGGQGSGGRSECAAPLTVSLASIIYFCVRRLLIRFGVRRKRMSDLDGSFPSISNDSMWFVCENVRRLQWSAPPSFARLKNEGMKQCQEGYQVVL